MHHLQSQTFTLDRRDFGHRFQVTAKRYTFDAAKNRALKGQHPQRERVTLILAHDAGLHKEQWEPFLEDLQIMQSDSGVHMQAVVSEAWSVDCPNHGQSAIVNEDDLIVNPRPIGCVDYARSIFSLLESGLLFNAGSPRSVIFCGHGTGATAAVLAAHLLRQCSTSRPLPFKIHSLFLLEPLKIDARITGLGKTKLASRRPELCYPNDTGRVPERPDSWRSQTDAITWLSLRDPWKNWDVRCLRLFEEYGLRTLPEARYSNNLGASGVILSCLPDHEAYLTSSIAEHAVASEIMALINETLPVHIVLGEDSSSCLSQSDLASLWSGKGSKGCGSVRFLKAGQTILQEAPTMLARHLLALMRSTNLSVQTPAVEVQARL